MTVIVLASSKGGVGKSTTALCLAQVLSREGINVSLLDADPTAPILSWYKQSTQVDEHLSVVGPLNENNIYEAIEDARNISRVVIVDLEGSANLAVSYAITEADLVLIPLQGSQLDADEAAKIIRMISRAGRQLKKQIPYMAFFTRCSFIKSRTNKHISASLIEADIPVAQTEIVERDAFKAVFSYGGFLHDLNKDEVSHPDKAVNNMIDFANEIMQKIGNSKKEQKHD